MAAVQRPEERHSAVEKRSRHTWAGLELYKAGEAPKLGEHDVLDGDRFADRHQGLAGNAID